jgi:hypothetical protein
MNQHKLLDEIQNSPPHSTTLFPPRSLISWLMIFRSSLLRGEFSCSPKKAVFMFMFDVQQLRGSRNCLILSPTTSPIVSNHSPKSLPVSFFIAKQICCRSNSRQTAGRAPRNGLWPNQFIYNWKFSSKATGARSERAPFTILFLYSFAVFFMFSSSSLEVSEEKLDLWNVLSLETCCFVVDPKRKLEISYDFVE